MKLRECYTCNRLVEDTDTEKIKGAFYCYSCFDFCQECGKTFPLNEQDERRMCEHCLHSHER